MFLENEHLVGLRHSNKCWFLPLVITDSAKAIEFSVQISLSHFLVALGVIVDTHRLESDTLDKQQMLHTLLFLSYRRQIQSATKKQHGSSK